MVLVKKRKILSLFVFGGNGPGNDVFMIIEVENKPSHAIKIWILHSCHIGFFKGVDPWFWSKNGKFPLSLFFWQNNYRTMSDDHPVKNQAVLEC